MERERIQRISRVVSAVVMALIIGFIGVFIIGINGFSDYSVGQRNFGVAVVALAIGIFCYGVWIAVHPRRDR